MVIVLLTAMALLGLAATGASAEALCTDTWTGPSEGKWQTASNWSGEHVPTGSDVACVGSGKTVTVNASGEQAGVLQGAGAVAIAGGGLELTSTLENSNIASLAQSEAGTLTLSRELQVTSSFSASGGTVTGGGKVVVATGASGTIGGGCVPLRLSEVTFVNNGTLTFGVAGGSPSGTILMAKGAQLQNAGTFNADSYGITCGYGSLAFYNEGESSPKLTNTGLFKANDGTTSVQAQVAFVNQGTIEALGGLELEAGGSDESGTWSASSGATVAFAAGSFSLGGTTWSGAGTFKPGTVTATNLHAGSANVTLPTGEFKVASGTSTVGALALSGGTLNAVGELQVTSSFSASGGTVTGGGKVVVATGASGTIGGGCVPLRLSEVTFVNNGTLTFGVAGGSPSGTILMAKGAQLQNAGTFNADSYGITCGYGSLAFYNEGESSPRITNLGSFNVDAGSNTIRVQVPFANQGSIVVKSGHLEILEPVVSGSSTVYGGPENPSTPGQPHPTCGDPVSCATGNLAETQTDLSVGGRGVGLDLARTYNSQAGAEGVKGPFGYGWTSSFSDHLIVEPSAKLATLVQANGSTVPFSEGSGGSYTPPVWTQDTLSGSAEAGYTLTLPDQRKYHFAGTSGRLESVTDRNANATTLSYGESGRLEAITDPAGRKITLTYNGEGLIESAKDPMGHVVKYAYEGSTLASVVEPGETEPRWRFKYDGSHQLTELTDGRGGKTLNEYNGSHQVVSQTDPLKHVLTFEYEAFHSKITNHATGSVTDEHFTSSYLPVSITRGFGTPSATTESFSYDAAGNVLSTTDGNGHSTKFTYDAASDRTSMLDPDNNETKWTYNATHDVETTTTPKGETTTIERDVHGNATKISRPAPASTTQVTKYKYAAHGELESVEDPLKRVWKYEYDAKGDRTAEIDPEADKRTWTYNEDSQQTSTVSPRGVAAGGTKEAKYKTTIERDAQGRPTLVIAPLKHETKYTYDADGNLETVTDPEANKTTYTYDADNEAIKVEAPNKTITETSYDGAGKVTSQIDGNKHSTTYVRNPVEEVTEVVDPLGRKTTKEYDAAGNLTSLTDAAKRTTTYKYDAANRLSEVSYSDGKTPTVQYEYDADGERTKMVDGTGTSKYTYDQLDRLTESKNGHGDVSSYEYDLANQQTKITYPNGKAVIRAYDNAGRLKSTTDWLEHTTKFGYDADSNLTATTFPTGTSNEDTYAFDEADRMSEVKMAKGAETLASLVYARNKDGGVTKATTVGLPGEEKPAFAYDENSRLTKGAGIVYKYDAADNPTKIGTPTYTYDNASQLATGTGFKYTYDEVGERTQTKPTSGPATKYGYDQAGNLTSVERPKEGEVAEIKDSYAADGNDLRASQTISGTTSYFAWDVTSSIQLVLNDGQNSYVYGPGDLPVEQISGEGAILYLHHDQQGSTRMLTGPTGSVSGTTTYDGYGNKLGSTGAGTTPLGYDGQYTSSDTGLVYLRARVYDPATTQFLTVDPMVAVTGAPYSYANDSPLSHWDPSGLSSWNPFSESFWTEGNVISKSPLNPIPYYEQEISSYENGCGYLASVTHGLEGTLAAAALFGGGEGDIAAEGADVAASDVADVTFGHGARHLAGTALDSGEVESAIQSQIGQSVSHASATGSFWGRTVVGGQTIEYRAYTLPNGTINVGTYYVVP